MTKRLGGWKALASKLPGLLAFRLFLSVIRFVILPGFSDKEEEEDQTRLFGYILSNFDKLDRKECIRMLNGLEKSLEKHLPESERRWTTQGGASLLNSEH